MPNVVSRHASIDNALPRPHPKPHSLFRNFDNQTKQAEPCWLLHILLEDAELLDLEHTLFKAQLSYDLLSVLYYQSGKSMILLDNLLKDSGVVTPGHRAALLLRFNWPGKVPAFPYEAISPKAEL